MHASRSLFLSLDGLDGTGKTTQLLKLQAWLTSNGIAATTCADPGGTEIGAQLREILLHGRSTQMSLRAESLMFMASRAELVERIIRPALSRGDVVLADRFLLANVVYQGHAGGLDPDDLWSIGLFSTGQLEPDRVLVLDLSIEEARQRRSRERDRIESRDDWYFQRVRDGFLFEARRRPEYHTVIDATGSPDEVQAQIRAVVSPLLVARGHSLTTV